MIEQILDPRQPQLLERLGFFDRYSQGWSDEEIGWFENLLIEDDVDVMAWAIGTLPVPDVFSGPQMDVMQRLDYIDATK